MQNQLLKFADFLSYLCEALSVLAKQKQAYIEAINYQVYPLVSSLTNNNNELTVFDIENLFSLYRLNCPRKYIQKYVFGDTEQPNKMSIAELCNYFRISKLYSQRKYTSVKLNQLQTRKFAELLLSQIEFMTELTGRKKAIYKTCDIELIFAEIDFFQNGYIDASAIYEFIKFYAHREASNTALVIDLFTAHQNIELSQFKAFFERQEAMPVSIAKLQSMQSIEERSIAAIHKNAGRIRSNRPSIEKYTSQDRMDRMERKNKVVSPNEFKIKKTANYDNSTVVKINVNYNKNKDVKIQSFKKNHPRNYEYLEKVCVKEDRSTELSDRDRKLQSFAELTEEHRKYQQYLRTKNIRKERDTVITELIKYAELLARRQELIKEVLSHREFNSLNAFNILDDCETGYLGFKEFFRAIDGLKIDVKDQSKSIFWRQSTTTNSKFTYQHFLNLFLLNWNMQHYEDIRNRQPTVIDFNGMYTWRAQTQNSFKSFIKGIIENTTLLKKQKCVIGMMIENSPQPNVFKYLGECTELDLTLEEFSKIMTNNKNASVLFKDIARLDELKMSMQQFKNYFSL